MKTFLKFEFTPTQWALHRELIETISTGPDGFDVETWVDCAVVELGFLTITPAVMDGMKVVTPEVLSDKLAVDILFYAEVPKEFEPYAVYPNPCGVHTFSGDESLYLKTFCAKFPDSPYCIVPEPLTTIE